MRLKEGGRKKEKEEKEANIQDSIDELQDEGGGGLFATMGKGFLSRKGSGFFK